MVPKLAEAVRHLAVLNVGKVKDLLFRFSIGKNESVRPLPTEVEDFYEKVAAEMFKPNPEFDNARKTATLALLGLLSQLVQDNPTMRFSQILQNYGFVKQARPVNPSHADDLNVHWQNEFYLEPVALLKRVQDRINDIENPEG